LIVGRGGGSLEDLLPFSEESVVRAIADSQIPVISAVGHEIDWALSDFAADLRAPTPSAAAEMVAASGEELSKRLSSALRHLVSGMRNRTTTARLLVERFSPDYMERTLRSKLQPLLLRLDDEKEELVEALRNRVERSRHRIALVSERLRSGSPQLIMQKGYALIRHKGRLLTDAAGTAAGDALDIRLARGSLEAAVSAVHPEENERK
jgi:exodeoxyribonuclease VII large subunit